MPIKIFPAAHERLLEIWDYTEKKWSAEQADTYLRGLGAAMEEAQGLRSRWRPVTDSALTGVFFIRYRHHFIFFRELSKGTLGIISILHENMDIPSRLKEDSERAED